MCLIKIDKERNKCLKVTWAFNPVFIFMMFDYHKRFHLFSNKFSKNDGPKVLVVIGKLVL